MLTHRQMSFCSYWDGANVLRFTPADEVQAMYPVRFTDRMKAWIEHKLDSRVDWYPLSRWPYEYHMEGTYPPEPSLSV
jgi:hypothetical protein